MFRSRQNQTGGFFVHLGKDKDMNPKIERVIKEIDKTKDKIATQQVRLRDLERQKINLENEEIVALFRREKLSEDEFAALLRGQRDDVNRAHASTIPERLNMEDSNGDEDE